MAIPGIENTFRETDDIFKGKLCHAILYKRNMYINDLNILYLVL